VGKKKKLEHTDGRKLKQEHGHGQKMGHAHMTRKNEKTCLYHTNHARTTRAKKEKHACTVTDTNKKKAGSCSYDTGKRKGETRLYSNGHQQKKKPKEITQKAWMGSAPGQRHGKKITGKI